MKAKDFLTESIINDNPEYIKDINGYYDFYLLSELIHRKQSNDFMITEMEDHEIQQLKLLDKLTTKNIPKIGEQYIPIFILYVHAGQIIIQGTHSFTTIVNIDNSVYYFDNKQSFPHNERLTKNMYTKLFLFDSIKNKEKFLNIISLKFNKVQPTITETL